MKKVSFENKKNELSDKCTKEFKVGEDVLYLSKVTGFMSAMKAKIMKMYI